MLAGSDPAVYIQREELTSRWSQGTAGPVLRHLVQSMHCTAVPGPVLP